MKLLRVLIVSGFLIIGAVPAFADGLKLPYPKPNFGAEKPLSEDKFECPRVPAHGLRDLVFSSTYDKGDPERDEANIESQQAYREQTKGFMAFENKLLSMTNLYYVSMPNTQAARARCSLEWLYDWAAKNAMLGQVNSVGVSVRHWSLASLASAYGQIRDEGTLDPEKNIKVRAWLRALAYAVIQNYDDPTNKRENNLAYWAAWAVTITGVALDDMKLYQWGVTRGIKAIDDISGDGTLPLEMERGSKAMQYHQFALAPMLMIAETAAANGYDLYSLNDGHLHRLVKRVLIGLESPIYFESRTGYVQKGMDEISSGHMAWIEVYHARYSNYRTRRFLKDMRPMISRRLGGNMTLLFTGASSGSLSSGGSGVATDK